MAKHISTLEMTHEEWMAKRRDTIGSSDIGAILQLSGHDSPRDIYNVKKGITAAFEGNDSTEWGTELEDFCAKMFMRKHENDYAQLTLRRDNKIRISAKYPWATCNLDRLLVGSGEPIILELKTTTSYAIKFWDAPVPTTYYAQLQWQMFVTGYRQAIIWVAVLDTRKFIKLDIAYSEEFAAIMEKAAVDFMGALVTGDPGRLAMTVNDYAKVTPLVGSKIEATEELLSKVSKLTQVKAVKSEAEKTEKVLAAEIKEFMGENEALVQGDRVLATYRMVKKDAYEVPASQTRVFNLQREKKEKV